MDIVCLLLLLSSWKFVRLSARLHTTVSAFLKPLPASQRFWLPGNSVQFLLYTSFHKILSAYYGIWLFLHLWQLLANLS